MASVPQLAKAQSSSSEPVESCKNFEWLLGSWESFSPWGDQLKPANGTLIFTLAADGTVEGRIGTPGDFTAEGYTKGMLVYRGFRTVRAYGFTGTTRFESFDGQFFYQDRGTWEDHSIGVRQSGELYMLPTAISRLAGGGPFRKSIASRAADYCAPRAEEDADAKPASTEQPKDQQPDQPDSCDWKGYFQEIRDSGSKLIEEFDQDTLKMVMGDNQNVPDRKLYPYSQDVRPSFISFDENSQIENWEKLVDQMVANQGADTWLKEARSRLLKGYRDANREYWQSAFAQKDCPGFDDPKGRSQLNNLRVDDWALTSRTEKFLPQELAAARAMRERLTRTMFEKLGQTGSFQQKLVRAAKDQLVASLRGEGVPPEKVESLTEAIDQLAAKASRMKAQGNEMTREQLFAETRRLFQGAGIDFVPSEREVSEYVVEGGINASKAVLTYAAAKSADVAKIPGFNGYSRLMFLVNLAEIGKGVTDLGDLFTVHGQLLPSANAMHEDAAQLEVLVRRYELFDQRFRKFEKDYQALFTQATANSTR